MVGTWPKPVTFCRAELMARARSDCISSSSQIKKFCDRYERFIAPANLGKYLDVTHGLLLPGSLPSDWDRFVEDDVEFLNRYANRTRKGIMGNLRRDWQRFLDTVSYLVRQKILPPSVIMDPAIPILPKNKMGWTAYGGDESFDDLLEEIDQQEPHRVWYWNQKHKHPFWTELVIRYPSLRPTDVQNI
jgi:hypothetical protein